VVPFDTQLHATGGINPRDSVMTNADKLSKFGGGGTNVSLCFQHLIAKKATPNLIVIVSDNESWMDSNRMRYGYGATASEGLWQQIKAKNPNCKLVCIDIQPGTTTQVGDERNSVLNVGGFSDQVFEVISAFAQGSDSRFWVEKINSMIVD
jgi:60 kDa SS-A/Ro ribonucleoprotein